MHNMIKHYLLKFVNYYNKISKENHSIDEFLDGYNFDDLIKKLLFEKHFRLLDDDLYFRFFTKPLGWDYQKAEYQTFSEYKSYLWDRLTTFLKSPFSGIEMIYICIIRNVNEFNPNPFFKKNVELHSPYTTAKDVIEKYNIDYPSEYYIMLLYITLLCAYCIYYSKEKYYKVLMKPLITEPQRFFDELRINKPVFESIENLYTYFIENGELEETINSFK